MAARPRLKKGTTMTSVVRDEEGRASRSGMIRQAFRLEYITLAWMSLEAAVAIGSGVVAQSLVLIAFGLDSVIELASAGVLIWRLKVELRHGRKFAEAAERRAARIGGALLFALAAYVVVSAAWKLWTRAGGEFSAPGLVVSALSIPMMYYLSRSKLGLAEALGSRALRADAIESITCGWLAFVVVGALLARYATRLWWIDPAASLGVVWLLVREGKEAWQGVECCHDH
jgi:divalent metal cation (Fe/Co/Zn/Cd) transporter